ncbi:MAG: KTSC domain-containing protein [Alphaproteobacteria bacterium]|nr:KTSC domain-containing protein [Alphaproteobacteria bacterium]
MRREPVSSSAIRSAGYEHGVLEIEFLNKGRIYQYRNVPPAAYAAFLEAPSKGTFVNKIIKNQYEALRIK